MTGLDLVVLIENEQFEEAEAEWLARIEAGEFDIDEFLHAARIFARHKEKDRALLLMGLLADELKGKDLLHDHLRVLKELARHTTDLTKLLEIKDQIREVFLRVYPNRPSFPHLMRHFSYDELQKGDAVAHAVESIQKWLSRDVGTFFYRQSYGVGQVKEINLKLGLIRIDFETRQDITVDPGDPELVQLAEDHILRVKVENPDKLRAMDPPELLGELIRTFGRPMSVGEIKECLVGVVGSGEWSKWWTAAKKNLQIAALGKGAQATYSWSDSVIAVEDSLRREFDETDLAGKMVMARRHASRSPDLASYFCDVLMSEAKHANEERRFGVAVELLELLEKWPGKGTPVPGFTFDEVLHSAGPQLLNQTENQQLKLRILARFKELQPQDWTATYVDAFLKEDNPRVISQIFEVLQQEVPDQAGAVLDRVRDHPFLHPGAFSWMVESGSENKYEAVTERLDGKFLLNGIIAIDEPEFAVHRTRIKKAIEGGLMLNVLKSTPAELAQKILDRLEHTDHLEDYRKERWKNTIRMHIPQTKEKIDWIFTTKESFERKRGELDQLLTVELPKNRKAVGEAAALGDLRENFEYKAARERQDYLVNRVQQLQEELQRVRVLDPARIDPAEVRPGTRVVLSQPGKEMTVTILGPWDSNPTDGIYSYEAPISKNLIGKSTGDSIEWNGERWTISLIQPWM